MKKGETVYESIVFSIGIILKMLTPPIYSFEKLEKYCKTRIKKNPKAYSSRSFLAGLYKDYQKNGEAKKEYLEIKDLGYMADQDWLGLAEVYFRLKDVQGVIETLAPIVDKYPHKRDYNWYIGTCYMEKKEFQKAITYLEKAIQARSSRPSSYRHLCLWFDYFVEKAERSIDIYKKGGYEDCWRMGYCYERLGRFEKAKEAYSRALSLNPDSEELKENLALIHVKIGQGLLNTDLQMAELEFKKALEIYPGYTEALKLLEKEKKEDAH